MSKVIGGVKSSSPMQQTTTASICCRVEVQMDTADCDSVIRGIEAGNSHPLRCFAVGFSTLDVSGCRVD